MNAEIDVRDHARRGDKQTLDTVAFQKALDACAKDGGGRVTVPPGEYLCGGLVMRSGTELRMEYNAVLYASTERADYEGAVEELDLENNDGGIMHLGLLNARDAQHIAVTGRGRIDGQVHLKDFKADDSPSGYSGTYFGQGMIKNQEIAQSIINANYSGKSKRVSPSFLLLPFRHAGADDSGECADLI